MKLLRTCISLERMALVVFVGVSCLLRRTCHAQEDKASCDPGEHSVVNLSPEPDPQAPDKFRVEWTTTVSSEKIVLEVIREWSPLGADRFYQLILDNFYNCAAFFRVVPDFVVQFGIASEPNETLKWNTTIPDDPVLQSNTFGYVSYATDGPDTRTSEIFINLANNSRLDSEGFSPFARVLSGMGVVEEIYNPTPNDSSGIDQDNYTAYGNPWILENYPNITLIWTTEHQAIADPTSTAASQQPPQWWWWSMMMMTMMGVMFVSMVL